MYTSTVQPVSISLFYNSNHSLWTVYFPLSCSNSKVTSPLEYWIEAHPRRSSRVVLEEFSKFVQENEPGGHTLKGKTQKSEAETAALVLKWSFNATELLLYNVVNRCELWRTEKCGLLKYTLLCLITNKSPPTFELSELHSNSFIISTWIASSSWIWHWTSWQEL